MGTKSIIIKNIFYFQIFVILFELKIISIKEPLFCILCKKLVSSQGNELVLMLNRFLIDFFTFNSSKFLISKNKFF
jgi:hypothetical protein